MNLKSFIHRILIIGAAFAFSSGFAISKDKHPELSLDEFKSIVEQKSATIIDVNSRKTFEENHIPGSFNFGMNESNFASKLPKDKNALIIAYCGGPKCTAWKAAAEKATALGYTNIKHFKGGIKVWLEQKLPVDKIASKNTK